MTKEEFETRNRFQVNNTEEFTDFCKKLHFSENTIFECNTLDNTIVYVRIAAHFKFMFFDIIECTPEGLPVRYPYKRGSTRKDEIAQHIYDGDWRIYGQITQQKHH